MRPRPEVVRVRPVPHDLEASRSWLDRVYERRQAPHGLAARGHFAEYEEPYLRAADSIESAAELPDSLPLGDPAAL